MTRFVRPVAYVAALLVVLGAGAALYRSNASGDETYTVTAYFEKAIGLFENSDVDILGVPVGKVVDIAPEGTRVKVVMEIDDRYKVPADAFAQIVPISVIADRYVQLHPAYESGPVLEDGAVLDVDRTQIPAELDDVFKQLKKLLEAVEPGKPGQPGALGALIVQLDETLQDRAEDLKGTLINTSKLTSTLAGAQEDISGLIVNLDELFAKLSTRAGSIGALNKNMALVLAALAESRNDIRGALANLGGLTEEVADLVRDNRGRLATDLRLATRITSTVLENRASVEESLAWLPVVAEGLSKAYHPPPVNAVDVRDNANAKLECEILDPLPDGPFKDALRELCREQTGEPAPKPDAARRARVSGPALDELLNCDEGVRKARRQIRRLSEVRLPDGVMAEVIRPLKKHLAALKKRCRELGHAIDDRTRDGILDRLPDVGDIPDLDDSFETNPLTGTAAGASGFATASGDRPLDEGAAAWLGWFLQFVGFGS